MSSPAEVAKTLTSAPCEAKSDNFLSGTNLLWVHNEPENKIVRARIKQSIAAGATMADRFGPDVTHIVVVREPTWATLRLMLGVDRPPVLPPEGVHLVTIAFVPTCRDLGRLITPPTPDLLYRPSDLRPIPPMLTTFSPAAVQPLSGREPAGIVDSEQSEQEGDKAQSTSNMIQDENIITIQPGETTEDFLHRIKPSGYVRSYLDAIDIADPSAANLSPVDLGDFKLRGEDLLGKFDTFTSQYDSEEELDRTTMSDSLKRHFREKGHELKLDIKALAREKRVVGGKWLLFLPPGLDLDRTWVEFARATAEGRLGPYTQVKGIYATSPPYKMRRQDLITIWTRSFEDREDVKRVLVGIEAILARLRLSKTAKLYYKLDAFTHPGLRSGNEYYVDVTEWDRRMK
ncbi:hypothetical protein PV11_03698 [Exophiala sideris]|uniref:Uncharacterized protein n=1 Tax=Exophiala sideris TaxID=1016849 RepID=A0A0D1VYS9_9EURO|nr:hypothetical protein PV11_03698 [Exophiala sideris]